jgi:hypothetical protein
MMLVWTTLFFAGASIAAVAGDQLSSQASDLEANPPTTTDGTTESTTTTETSADPAPETTTDATAPDAIAPDTTAPDASFDPNTAENQGPDAIAPIRVAPTLEPAAAAASTRPAKVGGSKAAGFKKAARAHRSDWQKVLLPALKPAPRPELEGPASASTVWLNTPLPDPTPPALRLSAKFAQGLRQAAEGNGVNWAVMLGVLRARGADGHSPADNSTLTKLGARLANGKTKGDWATIFAYSRDARFSDKATALARYDRAVGLNALVNGLEAAKPAIAAKLLADPMVNIYEGGRNDIIADKVDVRVLAVVAYLRETFGQVTVTSLISGHRLYARPGVISAHIPGHAVDIAALGGTPIQGHQEPGGLTERAVREILLLPQEVMPRQVISLLGLGGPSFPMGDHYNHIHVGF